MKRLVGVGEEDDDGELDAGVLGSIPFAETMQTTRRSEWNKLRLEASSLVGAISDHDELGFRPGFYKQRETLWERREERGSGCSER